MVASVDILANNLEQLSDIAAVQMSQLMYNSLKEDDSSQVYFQQAGAGQAVEGVEVLGTPIVQFTKKTSYGDVKAEQCKSYSHRQTCRPTHIHTYRKQTHRNVSFVMIYC